MEEISEEDSNHALQLLEAIWQIFAEKKVVRMHTKVLLDALKKIEEAPWEEANNGREINAYWLREKLKGFLPRPANPKEAEALRRSRQWREGNANPLKGYTEDHLREAWLRYLDRQTPTETAQATGPTPAAPDKEHVADDPPSRRGSAADGATDQPTETKGEAGLVADVEDKDGFKDTPRERGARNGPGPARRRTRPSESKPVGEA
jgi:Protein of unknown function (DUF3631)